MNTLAQLRRETGLKLRGADLRRAVRRRAQAIGAAGSRAYLARLDDSERRALTELLVVPESWLFRDAAAFAVARDLVCAQLRAGRSTPLRVLCAPCANGEEPYSLAITLAAAGVPASACHIDAIDLSHSAIAAARAANYGSNALRGDPPACLWRHLRQHGQRWQLDESIRARVNFTQGNLLNWSSAAPYDLIFCRNLLIYFDAAAIRAAAARLDALLANDGLLFVGYAEVPMLSQNGFAALPLPAAFALRKENSRHEAAAAPPPAPPKRKPAAAASDVRAAPLPAAAAIASVAAAPLLSTPPGTAPPPTLEALLAQARRHADGGDLALAQAACEAALARAPHTAEAFYLLGVIKECVNDHGAARELWRRCLYLAPNHYEALCHLALQAEQHGQAEAARAWRRRAARVHARAAEQAGAA